MNDPTPQEPPGTKSRLPEHAFPGNPVFSLFASYLGQCGNDTDDAFRTFCGANPEHETQLLRLRQDYRALSSGLPGPLGKEVATPGTEPPEASRLWRHLLAKGSRGDRYEERGEIGRGGMGVVIKVWDDELQRHLAMKVMRHSADQAQRSRFLIEAQLTSQLDHPGIVPVHELGIRSGHAAYYTMPLIRGQHLGAIFECVATGRDGWTQLRAVEVLRKVCDTVRYAHDNGLVHRDLKPANIMVGTYGEVHVMDWGLARKLRRNTDVVLPQAAHTDEPSPAPESAASTLHGQVLGTPTYMSPEQASAQHDLVDERTDVYALGAILYHLLTGHPPYTKANAATDSDVVLQQLRAGPPPPVRVENPGCAREIAAVCDRAMAREPRLRYQSIDGLALICASTCSQDPDSVCKDVGRTRPPRLIAVSSRRRFLMSLRASVATQLIHLASGRSS